MELWTEILACYSVTECEYAFENWNRNGHFFPKPADIIGLINAYKDANRGRGYEKDPHTGQGYSTADVQILWKLHAAMREQVGGRKLTKAECNALLDELDQVTGRAF